MAGPAAGAGGAPEGAPSTAAVPGPRTGRAQSERPGERPGELEEVLRRLLPVMVERVPRLLADVEEALRGPWPGFAAFLAAERAEVVAAATAQLPVLLTAAAGTERDDGADPTSLLFEEVGATTCRSGLELTGLLAAYQTGAALAWRHVAAAAVEVGAPAPVLTHLAESVFVFVDHLGQATARGYLAEQARCASDRERVREELAELLLSPRASVAAVAARAAEAGWAVPARAALVLLAGADGAERVVRRAPDWLPVRRGAWRGWLVPVAGAGSPRAELAAALGASGAVVGPALPLDALPGSAAAVELAARLAAQGLLAGEAPGAPVWVEDHLDTLVVHHDDRLLGVLRARVLAPLAGLPCATRERLEETLEAWLRHQGARAAVAEELHVHPQTVRYRVDQLRGLFGEALDDPRHRLRLLLALSWGAPADAEAVEPG